MKSAGTHHHSFIQWIRQWKGVVLLVVLIIVLLFVWYFVRLTLSFSERIERGEQVNLSSFEEGGISRLSSANTNSNQVVSVDNAFVAPDEYDPTWGSENAKITIVAFEDFQCPFCGELFPTFRAILNQYLDDPDVQFVYRDFPLSEIHPEAQKAAEAGQCAHEQNQFWAYHDKLYLHQNALAVADLKQYARELHLDSSTFDNCLDSGKYTDEVQEDLEDGIRAGVQGTPTLFFNGNKVAGVLSEEGFRQIIQYFKQQ